MLGFEPPEILVDICLALVRILLTVAFYHEAMHKYNDIKKFAEGHDMSTGMAYFVATAELLAAISMITGFMSQWAGLGIILLMLGTTYLQIFKWKNDYWANKFGWEYDLIMLVLALIIVTLGPGIFSIPGLF